MSLGVSVLELASRFHIVVGLLPTGLPRLVFPTTPDLLDLSCTSQAAVFPWVKTYPHTFSTEEKIANSYLTKSALEGWSSLKLIIVLIVYFYFYKVTRPFDEHLLS